MNKLIILRGYPGSGKTTIGKSLESLDVGKFIDHNEILNMITDITIDDDGIYNEIHSLEQAITKKFLKEDKNVIVARGFGSISSVQAYIDIANELNIPYLIFRINVPVDVLKKRVISPERKNDSVSIVSPDKLEEWIDSNPTKPIADEIVIDGNKTIEEINNVILNHL